MESSEGTPFLFAEQGSSRWPPASIVAVLLLTLPTALAWLAAAVALFVASSDAPTAERVLFGIPGALFCAMLGLVGLGGARSLWRGRPRGCGYGVLGGSMIVAALFLGLAFLRSLAPGRFTGTTNPMTFEPTMLVPIVLAVMELIAYLVLRAPSARAWLAQPEPRPQPPGSDHRI